MFAVGFTAEHDVHDFNCMTKSNRRFDKSCVLRAVTWKLKSVSLDGTVKNMTCDVSYGIGSGIV